MLHPRFIALLLLPALLAIAPSTRPADSNDVVLKIAKSFKDGGGYNVKWTGTGCPEEIRFKGERIMHKGTGGTYCCGFTLDVVIEAAADLHLLDDKTPDDLKLLHKHWYGVTSDPHIQELQCIYGLEHLGIGHQVKTDDARPGDFCQFYRAKGGHSVVFMGWAIKDGKRVGLNFRSSQESTKGIGDKTEYFADTGIEGAKVLRDRVYFGRLNHAPANTKTNLATQSGDHG